MPQSFVSSRWPNFLAAGVLVAACGLLHASFDSVPAGESPGVSVPEQSAPSFEISLSDEVPLPPDAVKAENDTPLLGVELAEASEETTSAEVQFQSDQDNIKFCLLLLKDGAEFLRTVDTYTAVFHKKERISGDMTELQSVEMKIRHTPPFAVHMKWRNGDRGRQLLYSEAYEDGDMVVKLGGLKGRLLPAIKLDPNGSKALSEARYPVTNAGILGMVEKIIGYRERDLKAGHGIRCQRLPNQEFDQRDSYCFVFDYESPDVAGDYRKSILLVDCRQHIPLMARNFVWAAEAADLSPAELDELTLVEDYSFTEIDFNRQLTAEDFSRDNPRYRM